MLLASPHLWGAGCDSGVYDTHGHDSQENRQILKLYEDFYNK